MGDTDIAAVLEIIAAYRKLLDRAVWIVNEDGSCVEDNGTARLDAEDDEAWLSWSVVDSTYGTEDLKVSEVVFPAELLTLPQSKVVEWCEIRQLKLKEAREFLDKRNADLAELEERNLYERLKRKFESEDTKP